MEMIEIIQLILIPVVLGIVNYMVALNKALNDYKVYVAQTYSNNANVISLQSKIDTIIERLGVLNERIARIEERMDGNNDTVTKKRSKKSTD